MPTMDALKAFLLGEYQQGWLPSDPSFLFRPEFLQHLLDFMGEGGHPPCQRCDAIVEGLQRQIDGLQLLARCLKGGAR
jgi:hypothetical protein